MLKFMRHILRDDTGATAVEYGLIVALIVLAMLTALQGIATENTKMWDQVEEKVTAP